MKILVAVDRTPESADAAECAVELFGAAHDYTFLSIADFETPADGAEIGTRPDLLSIRDELVDSAIARAVQVATSQASDAHIDDAAIAVEIGRIGPAICALAERLESDVVVMGSKERTRWQRIYQASAGRYVIDHAPCPVLVVR